MNSSTNEIIYVRLLGEGVDVWRPVKARLIADGHYEIDAKQSYDQEDEKWEYTPGSRVEVELRLLEGESVAVAVATARD